MSSQPARRGEGAEIFSLARAREVSQKSETGPSTSSFKLRRSPDFDQLVRMLELAQGVRLNGPGLGDCLRHHAADRDAFASCVTRALEIHRAGKSYKGPLSMLCGMAKRREDYRLPEPTAEELAELDELERDRQAALTTDPSQMRYRRGMTPDQILKYTEGQS